MTRLAWLPFVGLVAVVLAAIMALVVFEASYVGKIFPGVQMWGLDLGGMRPDEAALALEAHFPYANQPMITLRDGDRTWSVRPAELGLQLDSVGIAQTAYRLGRSGGTLENFQAQARLVWSGTQLGPVIRMDPNAARSFFESLAASSNVTLRDATLRLDGLNVVATPSVTGRTLNVEAVVARLAEASRTLAPATVPLVFQTQTPAVTDVSKAKARLEAIVSTPMTIVPDASTP